MLTRTIGRWLSWPIERIAALLARTGIPPNVVTWSALVLNLWATVFFAAGRFRAGAGMMLLAGLGDLLDGPVARRQGRVSLFGGFLESILDRYADLMLFLGLVVYYVSVNRFLYVVLACIAMAGAVMVSYAKARAQSLVTVEDVGFWERPERLVLMILGGLFNRMALVLWIIAIGANVTVVHRILRTWRQTKPASEVSDRVPRPADEPAAPVANLLTRTAGRGR